MPSAKYHVNANEGSLTNTKWVIIAIAAIITAIIVGGCIAAAIILTGTDDENGTSGRDLTTVALSSSSVHTTPIGNSESTGTSTTDTTRASSSTPATLDVTSTDSATTGGPSVATWLPWNDWLPCSVTCGVGIHRRYRSCKDGAFTCVGDYIENAVCTATPCPVYGKWTTWESWGSCSSSCGGGIQLRTRSCNTTDPNDLDCVGNDNQNKTCSNWNCPDCSQECSSGTLNPACDTCICENNIVTGHVVFNRTGVPLSNVFVYAITAPTSVITQTNTTGYFTLNTTCVSTELLLIKEGYVDAVVTIESNSIEVRMTKLVLPYFTQTPRPKYRLAGEAVTMCCTAVAAPGIEYYEWFKDSFLIETVESSDATAITLHDLLPSDSGDYQCRANSRYGAIMSPAVRIDIKENPNDFCENTLQTKYVKLPDGCVNPNTNSTVYDEGSCAKLSCRLNDSNNERSCENETYSCCIVSETDIMTVQCTDYEVHLFVVRACRCAHCKASSLEISGTVVDFEDDSPVRYVEVWANGDYQMFTSYSGEFTFEPSKSVDQINIYIVDTYLQQYLPSTKEFQISPDMTGTLHIEIKLFKASNPVELDSAVTNTLVAGTSVEGSAIVEVDIPSNAFCKVDGTPYNGSVVASLTFLDPTNTTQLENIPGFFEFIDNEGQQVALDTYGVFNIQFRDSDGQPLELGSVVDLYAPNNLQTGDGDREIKLWRLNTESGKWDYVPPRLDVRRKKRQSLSNLIGSIVPGEVSIRNWWNYDEVQTQDRCFFKVRLFQDKNLETEDLITEITRPALHVHVHSILSSDNSVSIVRDTLYETNEKCIRSICDNSYAYISAYDHRSIYQTYLYAAEPFLATSNPNVEYIIADDNKSLKVKMVRSPDGPFFEDYDECLSSSNDSAHLRWYYGISNENWQVVKIFNETNYNDINTRIKAKQMTWYPDDPTTGFRVCYLKTRLEFENSDFLTGLNLTMKLTTLSSGGTNGPVTGEVFGGRTMRIPTTENKTVCIEYKCSGPIEGTVDYTRVKIEFVHPISKMECTMTGNDELSFNISDAAQIGTKGGVFVFSAPDKYSNVGVYSATSDARDLDTAHKVAHSMCQSGGKNEFEESDLFVGVGVTFTCRPLCESWYWYNWCRT